MVYLGRKSVHNYKGVMSSHFCDFFLGLASFMWLLLSQTHIEARIEPGPTELVIEVHTVHPSSVDLTWSSPHGNGSELRSSARCNIIIWSSIDHSRQVLENYNLQEPFIQVKYLEEKTQYALFLSCYVNGTPFQSNVVDFRTGSRSLVPISTTSSLPVQPANNNDHTVTKAPGHKESSYTGDKSESDLNNKNSENADSPTIYKHKLSAFSNVLDATLGIMFAVFGGVVALVTACYVWKGWQRRQRFHRFMRHQDSSDQFDIIRQNITESS